MRFTGWVSNEAREAWGEGEGAVERLRFRDEGDFWIVLGGGSIEGAGIIDDVDGTDPDSSSTPSIEGCDWERP